MQTTFGAAKAKEQAVGQILLHPIITLLETQILVYCNAHGLPSYFLWLNKDIYSVIFCQTWGTVKKNEAQLSLPSLTGHVAAQMNSNVLCSPHEFCMLNGLKLPLSTQVRF